MKLTIIQSKIYDQRGKKIMVDFDLAAMYETETRILKQAVKRNSSRFPVDFMFQLTKKEVDNMVSQNVISSKQIRRCIALCIYRARCCHAFQCFKKRKGFIGKYSYNTNFRSDASIRIAA